MTRTTLCLGCVLVAVVAAAALIVPGVWLAPFAHAAEKARSQTQAETHASVPVRTGATPQDVYACGQVEGSQREIRLRFELPGQLVALSVKEGVRVRKGDVLARLDASMVEAQLAEAESNVKLARAERERLVNGARPQARDAARALAKLAESRLAQAKRKLAREEQLMAKKATAQATLDEVRSEFDAALAGFDAENSRLAEVTADARHDDLAVADAKLAVALAKVRQAKASLDKSALRAPTDGIVLRVQSEVGEFVSPQAVEPIVTMVNVDAMRVRAYVEEADAFRVAPGQSAYVTADGTADKRFAGRVTSCSPYMTPKRIFNNMPGERVDVKVREVIILLDPQDQLVVGLPVDVFVQAGKSTPSDSPAPSRAAAQAAVQTNAGSSARGSL